MTMNPNKEKELSQAYIRGWYSISRETLM